MKFTRIFTLGAIVLLILSMMASSFPEEDSTILIKGSWGKENGEFGICKNSDMLIFPSAGGIAVDENDNVYIVDTFNQRIQKFNLKGKFISKFGLKGEETGQFLYPRTMAIDKKNYIWVGDQEKNTLLKFSSDDAFVREITLKNKKLYHKLSQIAVDSKNCLYMTDIVSKKISKFDPSGKLISQFYCQDEKKHYFHPVNLFIDKKDLIYVYCFNEIYGDKIIVYNPGGKINKIIKNYVYTLMPKNINPDILFNLVLGLAVDSKYNIYTSDFTGIIKYNSTGKPTAKLVNLPAPVYTKGCLIALDKNDNLYLLNGRGLYFGCWVVKIPPSSKYWKKLSKDTAEKKPYKKKTPQTKKKH